MALNWKTDAFDELNGVLLHGAELTKQLAALEDVNLDTALACICLTFGNPGRDPRKLGLMQFLALCMIAEAGVEEMHGLGPSPGIDELWHAFMVDTQAYAAFCTDVMGTWLHHEFEHPPGPPKPSGPVLALLDKYFVAVDPSIWTEPFATCWPNC